MDGEVAGAGRRALNHLTAIKLALQVLERRAELTADQRRLVATALGASDGLAAELLAGLRCSGPRRARLRRARASPWTVSWRRARV